MDKFQRSVKYSIFLIFVLIHGVLNHELCNFYETVNISSGYQLNDSFVAESGVIFPPHTYSLYDYILLNSTKTKVEPHVRGCICEIKTCVSLCCRPGSSYEQQSTCVENNKPLTINITNDDGKVNSVNILVDLKYYLLHNKPCQLISRLEPEKFEEDRWTFHQNGSVTTSTSNGETLEYTHEDYCIANYELPNKKSVPSIFICFDEVQQDYRLTVYSMCMIISVVFLIITLLIYTLNPELKCREGRILIIYASALTVSFILLPIIQMGIVNLDSKLCVTMGYLFHISILISFFWLNVMAFDTWYHSVYEFNNISERAENKRLVKYAIYAFSAPIIIIIFGLIMQLLPVSEVLKPNIGYESCFLSGHWMTKLLYFNGPVLVILLINIVFFSHCAIYIHRNFVLRRTEDGQPLDENVREKERFSTYLKLFITMGLLWLMELISWFFEDAKISFFFVTDILNCLQGVFIFIIFVCKKDVLKLLKEKYHRRFTNYRK